VHREPDVALHLSVRGAPDAAGDAGHRRGRLQPVHRAAPSRPRRVLPGSVAAMRSAILGGACVVALAAAPAFAQRDEPLQLAALQRQALEADARAKEIELLGAQTDLRARNLEAERYPAVSVLGQAQLQSDVPTPPPFLPGGQPLFVPPKDTYDVSVRVDQ